MIEKTTSPGEGRQDFSLRTPLLVVLRHKGKVLLCFAFLMMVSTALALTRQENYRAEAKLLVKIGRESVSLDPTASMGPTVDLRQDRNQELRAELTILQSPDLCHQVVRSIGAHAILEPGPDSPGGERSAVLEKSWIVKGFERARDIAGAARDFTRRLLPGTRVELPPEEKAFLIVRAGLNISLLEDSSVLTVVYESPAPQLARRVVAELIEGFQEKHLEIHRTPGSFEFFAQQSKQLAAELETAEQELRKVRAAAGIVSLEGQRREISERLAAVHSDLDTTETGIVFSQAKTDALRGFLPALEETVFLQERVSSSNPTAEHLRQRVHELLLEEQKGLQDYQEDSRHLLGLRAQIEAAQALLEPLESDTVERTQGPNLARQQIELGVLTEQATLTSLRVRRESLTAQEAALMAELLRLNSHEFELAHMLRRIGGLEENYKRYAEAFEQARVGQALEMEKFSNIRVVQPPSVPMEGIGRGRAFFLALGLLASLIGSIALAFASDALDRSIKTPEEAHERLLLPTLAVIPRARSLMHPGPWKGVAKRAASNGFHSTRGEFTELGDVIQALGRGAQGGRTILGVTSAQAGEGVTTISTHMAVALAGQSEGPVLLVDAALENPCVHRRFQVEAAPGLRECLSDPEAPPHVQETAVPNLFVLAAGQPGAGQLSVTRLRGLFEAWKQHYALVIVDLSPVSAGAVRLADSCDAVLLVVQAERHPWEVVDRGRQLLQRCQARLLGTVLNKRRFAPSTAGRVKGHFTPPSTAR